MGKITKMLLAATVLLAAAAQYAGAQQDVYSKVMADKDLAAGIFSMLDFDVPAHAKAPKGYKPFYISHYGRHGARNHSTNEDFVSLYDILSTAHEAGNLTEAGEKLYTLYAPIYPTLKDRGGDLTRKGREQHRMIAEKMYTDYPKVFKGKGLHVDARATTVPRCIMSMAAFCDALKGLNPKLDISYETGRNEMAALNPFSIYNPQVTATDEGYNNKNAAWRDLYEAYYAEKIDGSAFAARILKDPSACKGAGSLMKLVYKISSCLQCTDWDGVRFWEFFTDDELFNLFDVDNYRFYLSKGPDTLVQAGRQWAFVDAFMEDVITKAEEDIQTGAVAARLRFGHDITLMSLLKFLEVEGWNKSVDTAAEVAPYWQCYNVPMASNAQFIFYRNRKGNILVRAMYNGRDIVLPIASDVAPYYAWEDFDAFVHSQIDKCKYIIANTKAPKKVR